MDAVGIHEGDKKRTTDAGGIHDSIRIERRGYGAYYQRFRFLCRFFRSFFFRL